MNALTSQQHDTMKGCFTRKREHITDMTHSLFPTASVRCVSDTADVLIFLG